MSDLPPADILSEIKRAQAYRAEWGRRYRRLDIAYHAFRWTGLAWEALGVGWSAIGLARNDVLWVVGLHWVGCLGLALLHNQICFALVRAQERLIGEMATESARLAAYLSRG